MPKEVNGTNGIFYRDPRKNPSFYNHTTIGLKYCDGGGIKLIINKYNLYFF